MNWTVVVPFKPPGCRKTRLAPLLSPDARDWLALNMFRHVTGVLAEAGADIIVLSLLLPQGWEGRWHRESGAGLNAESDALQRRLRGRWAVVHADLPLLRPAEVVELFAVADQSGLALAPDRHGTGTNAVAVADGRQFAFRFGPGSLSRFAADAGERHALVRAPGLETDIDTLDDLASAASNSAFCPDFLHGAHSMSQKP